MPKEERDECGTAGHEWSCGNESNFSARRMGERFIECIEDYTQVIKIDNSDGFIILQF